MAVGGALALVFSKNAIHSVVGFLLAMLSVAGLLPALSAEFLAVAQLLVYAGGIVVLFLFVVMLVEMTKYKEKGLFQRRRRTRWRWRWPGRRPSSACSGGPGSAQRRRAP